jgi:chromate transporter
LVDTRHWLTTRQLLDAVAVGQVTPGPVFTTATFIGFLLGGVKGALAATVAIFLPGFVFVALSGPLIPRIRKSPVAAAFLDGVTVGSIALIAWTLVLLGRATLLNPMTIGIAVASFVLLTRFRVNPALLVAVAALTTAFTH